MENDPTRPPFLKWLLFYVLPPFGALFLCLILFGIVVKKFKPEPPQVEAPRVLPTVNVIDVEPTEVAVTVESQGTVQARTQTNLLAEVSGRVESISPALYAGGFFKKGDVLVRIDPTDYQANLATARGRLAEAKLAYEQELAATEQAEEDWKAIGNGEPPSELALRKPQLAQAEASLEAARAAVQTAERDLKRANVIAPYDGRVHEKFVDIGQFVTARQSQIASIYSVDAAEIRLPIALSDTRYVDIPEAYQDTNDKSEKPIVTIEANYGGRAYQWTGVIDRSEGAIDPQTRLLNVVARIEEPYRSRGGNPPLKIGTFVTARIHGDSLDKAFVIPRKALREDDTVFVINKENRLEIRPVDVYQKTSERAIISSGIETGEQVCVTPLQYVVDGMEVVIESEGFRANPERKIASTAKEQPEA